MSVFLFFYWNFVFINATLKAKWHQDPFSSHYGQYGIFGGLLSPAFPTPDESGVRPSPPVVHVDEFPNGLLNAAF